MTCIVGLTHKNKVYIGGDSAGVAGYNLQVRSDEKVFKKDNMIFGFTSSFRMGQIIRYCLKIPEHFPSKNDYEYLCSTFIDALIGCFKEKGYATVKDGSVSGRIFLLGYKGNLYKIESDFQVGKVFDCFDATGYGQNFALGALSAIATGKIEPEKCIEAALQAAEKFSAGVSSPFKIVTL